jgi:hypothetical protein
MLFYQSKAPRFTPTHHYQNCVCVREWRFSNSRYNYEGPFQARPLCILLISTLTLFSGFGSLLLLSYPNVEAFQWPIKSVSERFIAVFI